MFTLFMYFQGQRNDWFFHFSVVKQNETIIMDVIVGTGGDI